MPYLLLNTKFEVESVVEGFESLIWTDRFSSFGDFELYLAASMAAISQYKADYYLYSTETTRLMIVEGFDITTDPEQGSFMTVTGKSLEYILDRRIIWNATVLTGNLQTGVQKLLNENAIAPTDATRRIPELSFKASTDPKITSLVIDTQFWGENLYASIAAICQAYDIGFKITMPVEGRFEFELYAGEDRSSNQTRNPLVIFTPTLDNLASSSYVQSKADYKTVTLVHGEGNGAALKYTIQNVRSGTGAGLSRREIFTDATSTSSSVDGTTIPTATYIKQLQQKGQETLGDHQVTTAFDGQVLMLPTYVYDKDFFMGDILQMENEYGLGATSRVMEFIRSTTAQGIEAFPTLTAIEP